MERNIPLNYYENALRIPIYKRYHINRFKFTSKLLNKNVGLMLDIGCNDAIFTKYLAKKWKPSYLIGLDLDREIIINNVKKTK